MHGDWRCVGLATIDDHCPNPHNQEEHCFPGGSTMTLQTKVQIAGWYVKSFRERDRQIQIKISVIGRKSGRPSPVLFGSWSATRCTYRRYKVRTRTGTPFEPTEAGCPRWSPGQAACLIATVARRVRTAMANIT